jgi:hypothetical protein
MRLTVGLLLMAAWLAGSAAVRGEDASDASKTNAGWAGESAASLAVGWEDGLQPPPGRSGRQQGPRNGQGPPADDLLDGPPLRRPPGAPPGPGVEPLVRSLMSRDPALARRVIELERISPALLEEAVLEALLDDLGAALDKAEKKAEAMGLDEEVGPPDGRGPGRGSGRGRGPGAGPPGGESEGPPGERPGGRRPPRGGPPGMGPGGPGPHGRPGGPPPEVRALEREHAELDAASRKLAQEWVELPAGAAEKRAVLEELTNTVRKHFEVRTKLRQMELEHIQGEVEHLTRRVERMERQLERRESKRDEIVERRVKVLLGERVEEW